jgi:hypothetical protein
MHFKSWPIEKVRVLKRRFPLKNKSFLMIALTLGFAGASSCGDQGDSGKDIENQALRSALQQAQGKTSTVTLTTTATQTATRTQTTTVTNSTTATNTSSSTSTSTGRM